MWLSIYLCGWLLTAVGLFAVADSFACQPGNRHAPSAITYATVAVAAGALWPALFAGLIELACVQAIAAMVKRAARKRERKDPLLTDW